MTDVFKNFTGNVTTSSQEMFAVPVSNVANNEPVTTYVAKSIYIVHSVASPTKTQFTLTHFDASANTSISFVAESKTTESFNVLAQGPYVFESGDTLSVSANNANQLVYSVSLLSVKQQI